MARPTFEVSPADARARGIENGDYCRLFNDRGEVFGHALIVDGLLPGVDRRAEAIAGLQATRRGQRQRAGEPAGSGHGPGPVFYSTLAEIEKVTK